MGKTRAMRLVQRAGGWRAWPSFQRGALQGRRVHPRLRLHSSSIAGAGMGLALCLRIVEHHGGCIWVASEPGNGSLFSFCLPDASPACHDAPWGCRPEQRSLSGGEVSGV
ncbi:hypothetical protein G3480_06575 [Thiorhodococcus mannitoliphagus]|uniref:histidine kinase n=1 Tax=Thiorhodococcus mannitoliphagus TaxID=329406 RepID=A0A6P1DR15_9GAMM|nr:hypothetical protein [Thiorhodococcus mannitoliphagus]